MSGKSIKLVIGIILLLVALALFFFAGFNYWIAIVVAVAGLILIILSFKGSRNLPAVTPQLKTETDSSLDKEKEAPVEEVSAPVDSEAPAEESRAEVSESQANVDKEAPVEEESKPQV